MKHKREYPELPKAELAKRMSKVRAELAPKKELVTPKYLDISTGHVAQRDMKLLEQEDCPLTVYPFEYGCWVHVAEDVTRTDLEKLGYSEGFCGMFVMARAASCWFIKLDCDGEHYEGLTRYEW